MTCEEKEGDSKKLPLGERDKDVGVSLCPLKVKTSALLRMS